MQDRVAQAGLPADRTEIALQQLLHELAAGVPGCLGVGVSVRDRRGGRVVSAAGVAAVLDPAQWAGGAGPLVDAVSTAADVLAPAPGDEPVLSRWPALAAAVAAGSAAPVGGVVVGVAAPAVSGDGRPDSGAHVLCSLYLLAPPPAEATVELGGLARTLARVGEVVAEAASQRRRTEQLREMVEYRRVIEQAKGLVMGVLAVDAGGAFATLTRASQHFNVRLRNLSIALVEHVGGGRAEVPDEPGADNPPSEGDRRAAAQVWAALLAPGAAGGAAGGGRHDGGRGRGVGVSGPGDSWPGPGAAPSGPRTR